MIEEQKIRESTNCYRMYHLNFEKEGGGGGADHI